MIEYITFKNEKLPIKICYSVLKNFKLETGKEFNELDSDFTLTEPLLFYSLKSGYKAEGKEFNYKIEDMEEILDECYYVFLSKLPLFFDKEQLLTEDKKK